MTEDGRRTVRGIALAILAYLIWTLGDVVAKWAIPMAGVGGAMFWRGVFGSVTVAGVAAAHPARHGIRRIMPVRWKLVLLRSALSAFVSVTWYVSWRSMSLADSYAVGFTAPLIMTVLAIPMLGERIRWRRVVSTAVGFAGVLIMLQPGGDLWTLLVLMLMAGVVVMSVTRIMTRQLSTTET
ncbi:MAG: DMT family transporter, partial [Acetobacteraceae bacterium]|nr:DMT family transporter [Acetobacteraceae bacterium]